MIRLLEKRKCSKRLAQISEVPYSGLNNFSKKKLANEFVEECKVTVCDEQMKSYVPFHSGHKSVDEMEMNRLFWEACLAS